MSAKKCRFRIRGLEPPTAPPPQAVKSGIKSYSGEDFAKMLVGPELKTALKAIGRPVVTDFIPYAPIDRLNACWPTVPFFTAPRHAKPIKTQPLALGPYFPPGEDLQKFPALKLAEEYYQKQIRERDQIEYVLTLAEGGKAKPGIRSLDSPIALALFHTLFERSRKDYPARILEIVTGNPVAAYLMLQIGTLPGKRDEFIHQVLSSPQLTFDLCGTPRFRDHLADEWLPIAFEKVPHLLPLARFAQLKYDESDAWEKIKEAAEDHALAAALAIGIDPTSEQAKEWNELVLQSPEAIYWATRVWRANPRRTAEFSFWLEYQTYIKKDVNWLYHWIRDIDQTEARDAIRWHWPSPWMIDLIEDLQMEVEVVRNLYETTLKDTSDDLWSSTVIQWGAAYIQAQEGKENETSEDE